MSTDTTTTDDAADGQTDDASDFGRLTVRAIGPIVQTEPRNDVTIARQVQAQFDRELRDADDLWYCTKRKKQGSRRDLEDAVRHLLEDHDDLRPPQNDPQWAADWQLTVEGSAAAWVALAEQAGGAGGPAEYLEKMTRRAAPGENLYLAALEYVDDMGVDREELLERYRAAAGMDGDCDD